MRSPSRIFAGLAALALGAGCARSSASDDAAGPLDSAGIRVARLAADGAPGLEALRAAFRARNPGYDLAWHAPLGRVEADERALVLFVQTGAGTGVVSTLDSAEKRSALAVGDLVVLRPGEALDAVDAALGVADSAALSAAPGDGTELAALAFTVPAEIPPAVPTFVRPDHDPRITDEPGGCATETGAYRRILLTWLAEKGPYVLHALNAHRVRITDSFTHVHPVDGGFDELYLVQMAGPAARLLTSTRVAAIREPDTVTRAEATELLVEHRLQVGELVYLPRGVAHRGLGGALVQVITVPGFRPGAEIGLDHHLRAIAERLGLEDELPYNVEASASAVVR